MRWLIAFAGLVVGCGDDSNDPPDPGACEPIVDVAAITSGQDFSCALLADGGVRCWGAGESGQLGDGGRATRLDAVTPADLGPATMVSAGAQHACALVETSVWCWGRNDTSQLGMGDRIARDVPDRISTLPPDIVGVSAGGAHSCAWTASGELYCWGQSNGAGSSMAPVRVMGVPAIAKAAASSADGVFSANHGCAIGTDGSAWCWGSNGSGQLGIGDPAVASSQTPVRVATDLAFVDIGAGLGHTCARTADGVVACWGLGADGELGDGGTENRFAPVIVAVSPSVELAVNEETTCSRDRDGVVECWGDNDRGQIARTGADALVPERIDLPAARAISAGANHACAIDEAGVVSCWGSDRAGQRTGVLDTAAVIVDADADSVAAGGDATCVRSADGRARCWGYNAFGQLADGTRTSRATPMAIGLDNVAQVAVGLSHACALLEDGRVACWGNNERDRVLLGGDTEYLSPQTVFGIGVTPTSIAAGGAHTCVVGASGVPWCWGDGLEGRLGRSVAGDTSAPVASMFANVESVATGGNHTCIVTTSREVWCAGRDNEGQIGRDDNQGDVYVPLEVTAAPSATMVAAGGRHTCAIDATGGGWCWGNNVARQLGDGGDMRADEPRLLALTGLVEIAAGAAHTCARDANNNVWCWGANTSGQLGDGTLASRGLPTLATELTGGVQLALGTSHTCVRMPDRTVRCVGARVYGQTGGGAVPGPAPVAARLTCP